MTDDLSYWAHACETRYTAHDRSTWFMTRIRDLERLEQGLRQSGYAFLSGKAPYTLAHVEQDAERIKAQADFIVAHLRALDRLRRG